MERVRGHRPGSRIIWLYGPAGWFKSNMAVTWTLHLYTGLPFCGMRVPRIETLYIDPDDPDGAIKCAQAWFKQHREELAQIGITCDLMIEAAIFDQPVNLFIRDELEFAIEDIKRQGMKPELLTVDTVFHNSGGADLSEGPDAKVVCENMRYFTTEVGAFTGLGLHHNTKYGKVMYGGQPFFIYADSIVEVTPGDGRKSVTLSPVKMRGPWFDDIQVGFDQAEIETEPDDDGNIWEKQYVLFSFGAASNVGAAAAKKADAARKEEQDLILMITVLREYFGNRATNSDWQKHMETYHEAGWSRPSFMRRLNVLKGKGWVRVVGADGKPLTGPLKANQGEFYEATELAPIVAKDGTNTTWTAENQQAVSQEKAVSQKQSQYHPLRGDDTAETAFEAVDQYQPVSNQSHETGETASSKSGNGQDPVASDGMNGSAAELDEAAKVAMEQLKKGKPQAA